MFLKLIYLLFAFSNLINGQMDTSFCDSSTIPTVSPQQPFPIPLNPTIQYQMNVEYSTDSSKETQEYEEYFDGLLNQVVSVMTVNGVNYKVFVYDKTNEFIVVSGDVCLVQNSTKINDGLFPNVFINGTEHVISIFQIYLFNDPTIIPLFIGNSVIRGIDVIQWQYCYYDNINKITKKLTFSFSNPNTWTYVLPKYSLPVELKIENKLQNGTMFTNTLTITKFRPKITTEDEFWVTPTGVYCPNRQLGKSPPKLPNTFSFRSQVVSPIPGYDDLLGSINNIREIYDYPNKLFRFDYNKGSTSFKEIHDYKTGLRYTIDKLKGNCSITKLDETSIDAQYSNGFITMKNSSTFFNFDDASYQYVGQKHVDHINTDVWIGTKMIDNTTTTWEWYFMAPGYLYQQGPVIEVNEPVLLIITYYKFNNATSYTKVPIYYYFYDFDETGFDTFEFDISVCMEDYPSRKYYFEILETQYRELMKTNRFNLKLGTLIGLTSNIAVYPTRITNLDIDLKKDDISVVFTLLERAPFYGNVDMTIKETSLDDAVLLLRATVSNGKLKIPFIVDNNTYFDLTVKPNSLKEIDISSNSTFNGNPNWCVPPAASTGATYPTLPNQFQTVVEANFRSKSSNFTAEFEEYYDFFNNRGVIIQNTLMADIKQYFLYDTDEMITIFSQACYVTPLEIGAIGTQFGYDLVDGNGHIFSPTNALSLEYDQQYIGEEIIRGISVQTWFSCAYLPNLRSTVKIFWSFSNNQTWNSTIHYEDLSISVPVQLKLEGLTDNGEEWKQNYEYIKFRPYLADDAEIFETPVGIYCPGRKPTKSLPKIPTHFSYRFEATSTDLNITVNQAEWYDDENKLVRIDHQPIIEEDIQKYGKTVLSEIHDFKRGIKFIIDKKSEKCLNYTVLDPQGIDSDYSNNTNFVRMRTALELFNFDKNASAQYQYHGSKKIRNIDCDVWIAIRENWPPQPNVNRTSTWEWYFMSANWTNYNFGIEEYNIPVKLIVTNYNYLPGGGSYISNTIVYNFFDYNQEKPDIFAYNLQYCFDGDRTKHLMFKFNAPYTSFTTSRKEMKYAVLSALSKVGYLLPTRITDIDFESKNNETTVVFKLLDKISIIGDVENPVYEINLNEAYDLLKKSINNGSFFININGNKIPVEPFSLSEVSSVYPVESKDSLNTGVIIGSAFGGLVVGALVSALVVFIIRRKNSGDGGFKMSSLINQNFND